MADSLDDWFQNRRKKSFQPEAKPQPQDKNNTFRAQVKRSRNVREGLRFRLEKELEDIGKKKQAQTELDEALNKEITEPRVPPKSSSSGGSIAHELGATKQYRSQGSNSYYVSLFETEDIVPKSRRGKITEEVEDYRKLATPQSRPKSVKEEENVDPDNMFPELTQERKAKYFGPAAKDLFYKTYGELADRSNKLVGGCDELAAEIHYGSAAVGNTRPYSPLNSAMLTCHEKPSSRWQISRPSTLGVRHIGTGMSEKRRSSITYVSSPEKPPRTGNLLPGLSRDSSRVGRAISRDHSFKHSSHAAKRPKNLIALQRSISAIDTGDTGSDDDSHKSSGTGPSALIGEPSQDNITNDPPLVEGGTLFSDLDSFSTESKPWSALQPISTGRIQYDDGLDNGKLHLDFNESIIESYGPGSPRASFLSGVLLHKLPPRAIAVLRKVTTGTLNLSHLGLGDKIVELIANAIPDMPALHVLNLCDNKLGDVGMSAVLKNLEFNSSLKELDLSMNKIEPESAAALRSYVGKPDCMLQILRLRAADVDDMECAAFVESLMNNRHIQEIDMSENLLGKNENLNVVQPDFVTGGESLAGLIRRGKCPLHTLNLKWNMIRLGGADDLCDSIRVCETLLTLDLSYNALGRQASCVLGSALLDNTVIENINVAYNGIDEIGCFTICVGIKESTSIKKVIFDGNPIGEQGGLMLMRITKLKGDGVEFSAKECDVKVKNPDTLIRLEDMMQVNLPPMKMSDPYHRAIVFTLLDYVAEFNFYRFRKIDYSEVEVEGGKNSKTSKLELIRYDDASAESTAYEKFELESLQPLLNPDLTASNIAKVFDHYDKDFSDCLDPSEFRKLLKYFNIDCSIREAKAICEAIDNDGECMIDKDECINYLSMVRRQAFARKETLQAHRRIAHASSPNTRYKPPVKGRFEIIIEEQFVIDHVTPLSKKQVEGIIRSAKNSSDPLKLLKLSLFDIKAHFFEGYLLYEEMLRLSEDSVGSMAAIIPSIKTGVEAQQLLKVACNKEDRLFSGIQGRLGPLFKPSLGYFSGYYSLDLFKTTHRDCFRILLSLSQRTMFLRRENKLGDTSQLADWSCFRNATWNNNGIKKTKVSVTTAEFFPVPKTGKLEFDYVDCERDDQLDEKAISDKKVLKLIRNCYLFTTDRDLSQARERLHDLKKAGRFDSHSLGRAYWKPDMSRAMEVGTFLNEMYTGLDKRTKLLLKAERQERKGGKEKTVTSIEQVEKGIDGELSEAMDEMSVASALSVGSLEEPTPGPILDSARKEGAGSPSGFGATSTTTPHLGPVTGTSPPPTSLLPRLRTDRTPESPHRVMDRKSARRSMPEILDAISLRAQERLNAIYSKILESTEKTKECKCIAIFEYFVRSLLGRKLMARQLALFVEAFTIGVTRKTNVGSYRVELVITLFRCILDYHNFDLVLMVLSAEEHAALICRLGWLNVVNPIKLEGAFELDYTRNEERQMIKMLMHLSQCESGENMRDAAYLYGREYIPEPNWSFTSAMNDEGGIPKLGMVRFEYFCGGGLGVSESFPVYNRRRMLASLVLMDPFSYRVTLEDVYGERFHGFHNAKISPFQALHQMKSSSIKHVTKFDSLDFVKKLTETCESHAPMADIKVALEEDGIRWSYNRS